MAKSSSGQLSYPSGVYLFGVCGGCSGVVSETCQSWADLQGEKPLSISRELHNGQGGTVGFWDSRSDVGLFAVFQEDAK